MLDKIASAPKVGLNTFFSEFFLPRGACNNHCNRKYPNLKVPEPHSDRAGVREHPEWLKAVPINE